MRILFYCPLKPLDSPVPSGDREIARGLADFFRAQGHEVEVLSRFRAKLFWRSPRGLAGAALAFARAYLKARRYRPHLFFTYHLYHKAPDPFSPFLSLVFQSKHFIFEGMYSEKPRRRAGSFPGWWLTRFALRRAAHVFSDKTDDLPGLAKILPPSRFSYVPPAVKVAAFAADSAARAQTRAQLGTGDRPLILGVAMLRADRKSEGVEFLLECLGGLKAEGLEFHYAHIGGGERLESLKARGRELLGENSQFLGQRAAEEIRNFLNAADIFAFPGLDESFGLVYVEAQASGLPVVAFRNGGIPDAVEENHTGFLTPLFDQEAMKNALRKLLTDPALRAKMGAAGRKRAAERFDREQNYALLLKEMIKSGESA